MSLTREELKVISEEEDKAINELAEWMNGLTLKQIMFLKTSYEELIRIQALEVGNGQVH